MVSVDALDDAIALDSAVDTLIVSLADSVTSTADVSVTEIERLSDAVATAFDETEDDSVTDTLMVSEADIGVTEAGRLAEKLSILVPVTPAYERHRDDCALVAAMVTEPIDEPFTNASSVCVPPDGL
jgi:hypothetical protein